MKFNFSRIVNYFKSNPKRRYITVGVIIMSGAMLFLVFSNHGLFNRFRLMNEKSHLAKDISRLKVKKDSLKKEIQLLKTDTLRIERAARENYGMLKKGEEVYFVEPKSEK